MSYSSSSLGCCGAPGMGRVDMPSYAFWTRSERVAQADLLNLQVQSTARSVDASRSRLVAAGAPGEQFYGEWNAWKAQWQQFYGPERSSTLGPNPTTLRTFVDRYNSLEERFIQLSGVTPTRTTTQDTRAQPGSVFGAGGMTFNTYLLVGAGVIGVVSLAVLGTAVAATVRSPAASAAARLARNRHRRRSR